MQKKWWEKRFPGINLLLLALVIFPIFIIPALPGIYTTYLYPPFFSCIFLSCAFSINRNRKMVILFAVVLTILFWITYLLNWPELKLLIRLLQIFFFIYMVVAMVQDISGTPTVTRVVMIDAVTAYLLLGISFSLLVTVVSQLIPGAYNFVQEESEKNFDPMRENIYYTFVTFTTTGYGDIVPVAPLAKSLAILISITGQLYIATIIAMLVGKFSAKQQ